MKLTVLGMQVMIGDLSRRYNVQNTDQRRAGSLQQKAVFWVSYSSGDVEGIKELDNL